MRSTYGLFGFTAAALALAELRPAPLGPHSFGQARRLKRWPEPLRPTTMPNGESRQVRRARERGEAQRIAGRDWRSYLAARKQDEGHGG